MSYRAKRTVIDLWGLIGLSINTDDSMITWPINGGLSVPSFSPFPWQELTEM